MGIISYTNIRIPINPPGFSMECHWWVLIAAHETNGIFEYIDSMGVIVGSYPIRLNLIPAIRYPKNPNTSRSNWILGFQSHHQNRKIWKIPFLG